jgi:hypothetical protein
MSMIDFLRIHYQFVVLNAQPTLQMAAFIHFDRNIFANIAGSAEIAVKILLRTLALLLDFHKDVNISGIDSDETLQ